MSDEKLDRRVLRSRRQFRAALLSLLEEKDYHQITVQEIAERADLNRVTFYFHYKDKDALLVQTIQALYDDLDAAQERPINILAWNKQDALLTFQHIAQYARLYRALLTDHGTMSLIGQLIDHFAEIAQDEESARLLPDVQPPVPLAMVEHFYAGAFVALARWWLVNQMPYSAEQMAQFMHQLEVNSGLWAVGLDVRDFTAEG